MQARCPHCSSVFSTERAGIQFCPSCGQQINVPDPSGPSVGGAPPPGGPTPAPPGAQAPAGPPAREATPWERRAELGLFPGLWLTWKESLFAPEKFWAKVRPDANWTDALLYGWLVTVLAQVLALPMNLLNSRMQRGQMEQMQQVFKDVPPAVRQMFESLAGGDLRTMFGLAVGGIVLYPLTLIISGAIVHLFCMLWGASKHGFWATVRVLAYASGPLVLQGVPCVGFAAAIYVMVLQVWGIMKVQETTGGRAAGAVLTPIGLACCCLCGLAMVVAAGVAQAAR